MSCKLTPEWFSFFLLSNLSVYQGQTQVVPNLFYEKWIDAIVAVALLRFSRFINASNDVNLNNSEIRYLISVAQNIRLLWNLANKTMWGFPMKFGQKRDWTGDATLSGGGFRLNIILYLHSLFISITLISTLKLKLKIEYWSWNCKSSAYAEHIPSWNAKNFVQFFFLSGNFWV